MDLPAEDADSTPRLDYLLTATGGAPSSKQVHIRGPSPM